MAHCTHWVRETSIVWLVVCSLQCGYTAINEKHIYFNNSQLTWWKARTNCQAYGRDLFVPVTDPEPSRQFGTRNRTTYYWLGAMMYSTWKWTADGSPLYRNSRLSILPDNREANKTFLDNSVYRCHRHCGSDTHILGLSKNRCFCLGANYKVSSTNASGEPCPGNLDEVCGDAKRMSVYKRDLEYIPTDDGQCGYAEKENSRLTISFDNDHNCYTKTRRYACNEKPTRWRNNCRGEVCVYYTQRTWTEAKYRCSLVKLNSSTEADLKQKMQSGWEYWIGLVYRPTMKWIMDVPFEQEASVQDEYSSSSEPKCLAVSFVTWFTTLLSWQPCSSPYASICEVVRPSMPTTTMTWTQQHSSSPSTPTAASETPTYGKGATEPVTASTETQTGVFVGLGCAVVLLVVIIVVLLLMRQNKFCFKRKDIEQPVHFNTATQNSTHDLDVPTQTNTSSYTNITLSDMTDDKPMTSAVPMATVRPRVQPYDNTFHSDGDENDYCALSLPGKHEAPGTPGKPINSHIGRTNKGVVEDDYDVASTRKLEDRRDDTYNHVDSAGDNVGDTNDYYNTKSLFRDNDESIGRQDDIPGNSDDYSLAKRMTDA